LTLSGNEWDIEKSFNKVFPRLSFTNIERRDQKGTLVPFKGGIKREHWFPLKEGSKGNIGSL